MSWVIARPNETIESLLKRFKKAVENSGILTDLKKHEFFEKPSVKRKRKQAAARKRATKRDKKTAHQTARKGSNKNFKWNKDRTKKIPLPPPKKYTPKGGKPNTKNAPNTGDNTGVRGKSNIRSNNSNRNYTKKPNYIKRNKS